MDTLRKTYDYLGHLEWTEKTQHTCLFCDSSNFKNIAYEVLYHTPFGKLKDNCD